MLRPQVTFSGNFPIVLSIPISQSEIPRNRTELPKIYFIFLFPFIRGFRASSSSSSTSLSSSSSASVASSSSSSSPAVVSVDSQTAHSRSVKSNDRCGSKSFAFFGFRVLFFLRAIPSQFFLGLLKASKKRSPCSC